MEWGAQAVSVVHRMPMRDYRDHPARSRSQIWPLVTDTPAECRWRLDHHVDSDPDHYRLGDATHAAIFEPTRFSQTWIEKPRMTTKARRARWEIDHKGLSWLTSEEWWQVHQMRDALLGNETFRSLLAPSLGWRELSVFWEHAGGQWKGRLDSFHPRKRFQVDVKTTRHSSFRLFHRDCVQHGVIHQQAFYRWGMRENGIQVDGVLVAGVVKPCLPTEVRRPQRAKPHLLEIDSESLDIAEIEIRSAAERFQRHVESGEWPDETEVHVEGLPEWWKNRFRAGEEVSIG